MHSRCILQIINDCDYLLRSKKTSFLFTRLPYKST